MLYDVHRVSEYKIDTGYNNGYRMESRRIVETDFVTKLCYTICRLQNVIDNIIKKI